MSRQPQLAKQTDLNVTKDAAAEFLEHCYQRPIERLRRSFAGNRPLAILLGEGNSAASFVVARFVADVEEDTSVIRVPEPCRDATDLMRRIIAAAGFEPKDMGLADLESIFTMFLAFQKSHNHRTIVCLERLHECEWWVLDKIRKLVDLEVEGQYGMMVVISGQPPLRELLNTRPLSSLMSLAGHRINLAPFSLAETTECIRCRVEAADSATTIGEVFQYQAIPLIHELCGGILDAIEELLSCSLALAEREGLGLVTPMLVKRAYEASRAHLEAPQAEPDSPTVEVSEISEPLRRLAVRLTGADVREQALRQGHTLIGRSRLCDVRINSPIVSRHHALINYAGGSAMLVDLGSSNGTFVDGNRITSHELVAGETIRVGNCTIEYVVDDELQASFEEAARSAGIAIGSRRN